MRLLLAALLLYLLFLVQAALAPWSPDLVLLALFAFAVHEGKAATALLGLVAGLCLDLTAPKTAGVNILAYSGLAYGVASLHDLLYRSRWTLALMAAVGVGVRYGLSALFGAGVPGPTELVSSSAVTVALAIPVELLVSRLFYRRWNPS